MTDSRWKSSLSGITVMFDPTSLRDHAAEFRSIARNITDKQLRQALVKLALTYDAIAQRIDIGRAIARA